MLKNTFCDLCVRLRYNIWCTSLTTAKSKNSTLHFFFCFRNWKKSTNNLGCKANIFWYNDNKCSSYYSRFKIQLYFSVTIFLSKALFQQPEKISKACASSLALSGWVPNPHWWGERWDYRSQTVFKSRLYSLQSGDHVPSWPKSCAKIC